MSKMTLASCLILPAVLVLALVLLSASNTWHCWSTIPCCVAKYLDKLVVLPPLAHRKNTVKTVKEKDKNKKNQIKTAIIKIRQENSD